MPLVLYVMINTDLKMGKGKIAGQVGHAVEEVILHMQKYDPATYSFYQISGRRKVVLKATEGEMKVMIEKYGYKFPSPSLLNAEPSLKIDASRLNEGKKGKIGKDVWCVSVYDAGMTQIPANSLTAIGFGIMQKDYAPEEIKRAKLL